jgi:hypothetical protein
MSDHTVDQFAKGLVKRFGFGASIAAIHRADPNRHDFNQQHLDGVEPPELPVIHTRNRTDSELARDAAIQTGQAHVDPKWIAAALAAFRVCAQEHRQFTTDEVWVLLQEEGVADPHDRRAIVGPLHAAVKNGWIEPTDEYRNSARVKAHAGPKKVYASLICDLPATLWPTS